MSPQEAAMRFRRPAQALVLLAALAGLLLAAAPASAAPGDWWQYGYTAANTRFNPNETTIGPGNVGRLAVAARQTPTLGGGWNAAQASAVAVANGRAYVQVGDYESGSSALLAYDPGSFRSPAAWQQRSGCASPSPTVHLGIVFVGSVACRPSGDDGGVRAFDGATGQLLWYSHLLGIGNGTEDAGNVAATSGAVYVSIYQNTVYGGDDALLSLDARTGAVRWQVAGVFGDPAVAGGRVLAGAPGGQLQARSAVTGALLWSRPGGIISGAPSVTGGMVYALGTENGAPRLFARRADTGALAWKRAVGGRLSGAWPAVAGGKVLATTSSGIAAFDAASGAARWRVTVAGASSPAVANGLVFAGLGQGLGAWRLSDGVRRWSFGTIGYGAPVVSGGRLYVSGSTVVGDRPVAAVEQFALGAAPGAVS
jgi:outer membrane protein assembly factor BamB